MSNIKHLAVHIKDFGGNLHLVASDNAEMLVDAIHAGNKAGADKYAGNRIEHLVGGRLMSNTSMIVDRKTGQAVREIGLRSTANKVNRAKYDVIPTHEYLGSINGDTPAASLGEQVFPPCERYFAQIDNSLKSSLSKVPSLEVEAGRFVRGDKDEASATDSAKIAAAWIRGGFDESQFKGKVIEALSECCPYLNLQSTRKAGAKKCGPFSRSYEYDQNFYAPRKRVAFLKDIERYAGVDLPGVDTVARAMLADWSIENGVSAIFAERNEKEKDYWKYAESRGQQKPLDTAAKNPLQ